jgi:hypothetical protein
MDNEIPGEDRTLTEQGGWRQKIGESMYVCMYVDVERGTRWKEKTDEGKREEMICMIIE